MQKFETTKATILFVDGLPEDARSFLCNGFVIGFQHEKWRYFSKYKSIVARLPHYWQYIVGSS